MDVIVSWPVSCDYPLWREYIDNNRKSFDKVIVSFTPGFGFSYESFIRDNFEAEYIDAESISKRDWRDVAVNNALVVSTSDYVWFTEQDFIPKKEMWDFLVGKINLCDVAAAYQGQRLHPCCIITSRYLINQTKRDFGVISGISDHFSRFQKDLENMKTKNLVIPSDLYEHMNGLTSNFSLVSAGEQPNYEPDRFREYLAKCLECKVKMHPKFLQICYKFLKI